MNLLYANNFQSCRKLKEQANLVPENRFREIHTGPGPGIDTDQGAKRVQALISRYIIYRTMYHDSIIDRVVVMEGFSFGH